MLSTNGDDDLSDAQASPVLAGMRRLTLLADAAQDSETVFGALARELIAVTGAEEVHVHHLSPAGSPAEEERVVVHLLDGDGRDRKSVV